MHRDRAFLLVLVAAFGALSLLVVLPYAQAVLLAGLLAYVLRPVQRRLAPRLGRRGAAGGLVALVVVTVLVPLGLATVAVVRGAGDLLTAVREERLDLSAVEALADAAFGGDVGAALLPGGQADVGSLLGALADVAGGLADLGIGVVVGLFALYYLLADGDRLLGWLRSVTPLSAVVQDRLLADLDRLLWAVLVANVLVAVVQGVLTGLGMAAVGFSNPVFWMAATALLALLPLVGASVVWLPAAGYLALTGRPVPGVLLALWGAVVVSVSDDYIRPMATGRGARLSPGLLVVGIFGGVAALGVAGLFYGPVVLGFLAALVSEFARESGAAPGVAG